MKIYVAAPWAEKDGAAKDARTLLQAAGHTVTSRWIDYKGAEHDPEVLKQEAINDWEDVATANMLFLLNLQPRGSETSGKAVETGIALALGKRIVAVGEKSNVFHYLPHVSWFGSVKEALEREGLWS